MGILDFGGLPYESATSEAAELADRAVIADPNDGTAFATAAWTYFLIGRHAASLECAQKALQLHPNSAYVQYQSGHAFLGVAETERARDCFNKALEFDPIDARRYFVLQGIGMSYFFERNFKEAIIWFQRVNREAPFVRVAWRYGASALAHVGRLREAGQAVARLYKMPSPQTLGQIEDRLRSYRFQWMRDLLIDGLRKAGHR